MIIKIIEITAWPIVFLAGLLIFRYPIISFIKRTDKLKFGELTVSASEEIANKVSDQVTKNVSGIIKDFQYGEYLSRTQVFDKANTLVNKYLKNHPSGEIRLDIKITAVSMHYSWPAFVSNISDWLKEHTKCNIKLSILLVDSAYINKLPFAKSPINWAEETERRIKDLEELVEDLSESEKVRLDCSIKVFEGLPQYHGILINDDELFLGRTDWEFRTGKLPQLTVGQNRYRYFNRTETEGEDRGSERVNLFLHWHQFYYDHNSELVLNLTNGCDKVIFSTVS